MHMIDDQSAAPGGLFTEGDPVNGVPGTLVTADWLNAIQLELSNFIAGAGIALDKADNTQLLAAFRALVPEDGWATGDVILTMRATPRAGWIVCNDGTIGRAGSGATTRANDDTESLYTLLWTNVANTYAAVTGGRGASAAADFAAGKPLALTKMLGRALGVAGGGAGLTARALGLALGAEAHTLALSEMPMHGHGVSDPTHAHSVYDPGHSHTYNAVSTANGQGSDVGTANDHYTASTGASGTGIGIYGAYTGISIQNSGGSGAHNNMQPTAFLNAHIRL